MVGLQPALYVIKMCTGIMFSTSIQLMIWSTILYRKYCSTLHKLSIICDVHVKYGLHFLSIVFSIHNIYFIYNYKNKKKKTYWLYSCPCVNTLSHRTSCDQTHLVWSMNINSLKLNILLRINFNNSIPSKFPTIKFRFNINADQ